MSSDKKATPRNHDSNSDCERQNGNSLSTFSTVELFELEQEGRHLEVIQLGNKILKESPFTFPRLKAGLARSHAFVGNIEIAEILIADLLEIPRNLLDTETRTVIALARAAIHRRKDKWNLAKQAALRAFVLSKMCLDRSLHADAVFAVALALTEEKRGHLALDCYQRIRKDRYASDFRKSLATLNEACLLWDFGRWIPVAELLPDIPRLQSPRFRLMLDMIELRSESIHRLLTPEPPTQSIVENRQIFLLLSEYMMAMRGQKTFAVHETWMPRVALELQNQQGDDFWLHVLKGLTEGSTLPDTLVSDELDWRSRLERFFLISLSACNSPLDSPASFSSTNASLTAAAIYQDRIEPLLKEQNFQTALIPRWSDLLSPSTEWSKRLRSLFVRGASNGAPLGSDTQIRLKDQCLRITRPGYADVCIDLRSSGQSYRALSAIAGRRGEEFSKKVIHETLTGSRYASHLHDDRLQKLFKRLEKKVLNASGLPLWCWPRQNVLKLLQDITYG